MSNFLDLQNGWYNGLTQGLGLSDQAFQILQPAPPVVPSGNATRFIWDYFNKIPPASLTQNYIASGGNQFFSDYSGLMSALLPATSPPNFVMIIGAANFAKWQAYVSSSRPLPTINQLPTLFRSWAAINAPSVANAGAAAYATVALDPIASAQTELTTVYPKPNSFDWNVDYNDLVQQLAVAPSIQFTFDSATASSNVNGSWTSGSNSGFFGLWSNSSSSSSISTQFATSTVTVQVSFDHVLTFAATPGNWYSSSAMGLAFANQTGRPWNPNSSIDYDNTFGPNGNMQRFMASIIVASGMRATITSTATYSASEQTTIHNNSHVGFWPFYSSGSNNTTVNKASFDKSGAMTIEISTQKNVPIVLGGNVLPAGEFLGHSAEAAALQFEMLRQFQS